MRHEGIAALVLRRAVLLVCLGCLTTVGVAWLFSMNWYQMRWKARATDIPNMTMADGPVPATERRVHLTTGFGIKRALIGRKVPIPDAHRLGNQYSAYIAEPAWGVRPEEFGGNVESVGVRAFGFPRLALRYAYEFPQTSKSHWAIRFRGNMFPIGPLPVGFAIDTVVFALMWALLFATGAAARCWLRRRKGRCPKCAYDLKGDFTPGCPECGWNRTKTTVDPA